MNLEELADRNLREHLDVIDDMHGHIIEKSLDISCCIANSLKNGGTIFWCGNGGSAANAIHIANDYLLCLGIWLVQFR